MITKEKLLAFHDHSDDLDLTNYLLEKFSNLKAERNPFYLTRIDLDEILQWKLRGQYGRSKILRGLNTEEIVRQITELALNINHSDKDYELELRINLLCALRGVGIPVASAILALVYPQDYAVIDFRGWRQIFEDKRSMFSINDYKKYLREVRRLARELNWTTQEVDLVIWEYDRRNPAR
jgi:hypothetical protein